MCVGGHGVRVERGAATRDQPSGRHVVGARARGAGGAARRRRSPFGSQQRHASAARRAVRRRRRPRAARSASASFSWTPNASVTRKATCGNACAASVDEPRDVAGHVLAGRQHVRKRDDFGRAGAHAVGEALRRSTARRAPCGRVARGRRRRPCAGGGSPCTRHVVGLGADGAVVDEENRTHSQHIPLRRRRFAPTDEPDQPARLATC